MLGAQTSLLFLLPLRLCCGLSLLSSGFGKVASGWLTHPHLAARLEDWLHAGRAVRFYVPVLHEVLRHAQLASTAVALCELLAGAALFFGLFSRWAAFLGLLVWGNYLLASGDLLGNPGAPLCASLLTLTLCGSGRVLGLDAALAGRVPAWLS
jgi:uncharacterized membrane protein YphA (DoxX/SURF4 family)